MYRYNQPTQETRRIDVIYTLFFSRMREQTEPERIEYEERATGLRALVEAEHAGFVSQKTYVAEDGERLTVVLFRDEESRRRWALDKRHREAQSKGRTDYYERYRIVICEELRAREWERSAGGGA